MSQVAMPTCSNTTSTPRRSVRRFTSSRMFCLLWLIVSSAPNSRALRSFSSLPAVVGAGQALLAQPAAHPRRKHHLLPHLEVCYQLADLGDLARDVAAGDVGHGESDAWQAAPHPQVKVVERARPHAHQDLVSADLGLGHFGVAQHLRPTMLRKNYRFHLWRPLTSLRRTQTRGERQWSRRIR